MTRRTKGSQPMDQTQVYLPPALKAAVLLVAGQNNLTFGACVRYMIESALRKDHAWAMKRVEKLPEKI